MIIRHSVIPAKAGTHLPTVPLDGRYGRSIAVPMGTTIQAKAILL